MASHRLFRCASAVRLRRYAARMKILGLTHPYSWNTAAALLVDGELKAFAEEERFTRLKHAPRAFPRLAMEYCLREGGMTYDEGDQPRERLSAVFPERSAREIHQPPCVAHREFLLSLRI